MKRFAASILLLVYFTVTTGFVVSVHYCMNERVSVEVGYDGHDECGKCGMAIEKSNGCCGEEVKMVKLQIDHTTVNLPAADFALSLPPLDHFSIMAVRPLVDKRPEGPLAHGPPLYEEDIYLHNRVFRL